MYPRGLSGIGLSSVVGFVIMVTAVVAVVGVSCLGLQTAQAQQMPNMVVIDKTTKQPDPNAVTGANVVRFTIRKASGENWEVQQLRDGTWVSGYETMFEKERMREALVLGNRSGSNILICNFREGRVYTLAQGQGVKPLGQIQGATADANARQTRQQLGLQRFSRPGVNGQNVTHISWSFGKTHSVKRYSAIKQNNGTWHMLESAEATPVVLTVERQNQNELLLRSPSLQIFFDFKALVAAEAKGGRSTYGQIYNTASAP